MNKKYAVCVGINYTGTSAQLHGCVNDANDWTQLLSGLGYEVTALIDGAATKDAILGLLRATVARAGWADRIVFTYSGHGSWKPDYSGDEADRRDETLVPVDFAQGRMITDDELHSVFSNLRFGTGALTLSDSCHSGTVTRLLGSLSPGAPRFLSPAAFTDLDQEQVEHYERNAELSTPRVVRSSSLISGCDDLEYSYDAWFHGRANGAFSRVAIDTYKPGMSLNDWHKAIRTMLPNSVYDQTPRLSATRYRKYSRAL